MKKEIESDLFTTNKGPVSISFIGHGTLMIDASGTVIHVDPWAREADYKRLPPADLILITHHHFDHLDKKAVKRIRRESTQVILTESSAKKITDSIIMKNGDTMTMGEITIDAVPAYNTTKGRTKFHPKGRDNGYVITVNDFRIYVAGDTEVIPEMNSITDIDAAFLPVNQPYTMTPEQAAQAAKTIKPKILYPYHYGSTDVSVLQSLLKDEPVEVRIRKLS